MKKLATGGLLQLFLILSACSTLNPFRNEKAVDYNALTYGDNASESQNKHGLWGRNPGDEPRQSEPDQRSSMRNPASAEQSATSVYDDEALDPSDETVRARIEARRGMTSSLKRKGERTTRSDFYDNAPNDGSLWANENDGNYFFTKGKVHAVGDIISVKLEDGMIKQVAEEIKKSLTPAEQEVEMALYLKNSDGAKGDQDLKAYRNVASEDLKSSEAEEVKSRMEKAVRWSQVDLSKVIAMAPAEELRAEIVDRYQNGNLKIRAVKRVLYRGSSKLVSLVGVAPVVDFDEKDVINSGKLYEYKLHVAR
jgi:flagellar basal body L-ring protein FlgH